MWADDMSGESTENMSVDTKEEEEEASMSVESKEQEAEADDNEGEQTRLSYADCRLAQLQHAQSRRPDAWVPHRASDGATDK